MSKSKIFFYLCASYILGIFLSSFLPEGRLFFNILNWLNLTLAFVSVVLICAFWRNPRIRILGFCGLILIFGIWHYQKAYAQSSILTVYHDKEITFQGIVVEEPDIRVDKTQLTLEVAQIKTKAGIQEFNNKSDRVLVILPRTLTYRYGDKLEITGKLQTPKNTENFSYKNYLARYNIHSVCYYPEVKFLSSGHSNFVLRNLLSAKNKFKQTINSILPEPQASLLSGLLLGEKKAISEEVLEWFNRCGLTHIIVVSGYNITVVSGLLMNLALALYLSRRQAFWLAMLGIVLFVFATGVQAATVRAAIMGGLVLLAMHLGRVCDIKNAILSAATSMLLVNPLVLKFDLGFQLSFLATLGIVYFSPYLEKWLKIFPETFKIRESICMTLSAQLLTLPLILFHFERLSLIAPLANILILPFIPLMMMLGFIAGILALVWLFLGRVVAWFAWLFLTYGILVNRELAKIPFAQIEIQNVWPGILVIYYLILFAWLWWVKRKEQVFINSKKVGISK